MYDLMLKVAMAFNSIKYLGAGSQETAAEEGIKSAGASLVKTVTKIMGIVMPIIFAVVTVLGVAYAVVLGVNYAKAEDNEKREEAKKRLVGAIIGFGIAIVVAAVLWILASTLDWYSIFGETKPE